VLYPLSMLFWGSVAGVPPGAPLVFQGAAIGPPIGLPLGGGPVTIRLTTPQPDRERQHQC